MWRGIFVLAVATAFACAQPKFEIRGTVTDPNTNQPLQGVDVTMLEGNGLILPDTKTEQVLTDSQGAFRFQPLKAGQYVVRVRKNGYTRAMGISDQGNTVLSEQKPTVVFTLFLQRAGQISGVILDDETDKPLANFKVGINGYSSTNGLVSARGGTVTTDAEGRFRQEVAAGRYLIEIRPQKVGSEHILTKFTEEDVRATDLDYRSQFFPGGAGADTALPVPVASGGSATFGTIRVRKRPLYRVYANLDRTSCPESGQLSGMENILRFQSGEMRQLTLPCGPFLLTHMTPGEYELDMSAGKAPDQVTFSLRYTVVEKNLELPLRLSRGSTLRGTIVTAEEARGLPLTNLKVSFAPIGGSVPMGEVQPHNVDEKGRFEFLNVQPKRRKVQVAGLGTEYFIKEVRYRSAAQTGNIFYYTGDGDLEIEIGRLPASISGSVMDRDKPLPNADVVFLRWPAIPEDDRDAIRHIAADSDGKFQVSGIVPGEYRLFAVAAKDRSLAEEPAPWQRLVTRAEKLKLARGESQNLTIQASDPAR